MKMKPKEAHLLPFLTDDTFCITDNYFFNSSCNNLIEMNMGSPGPLCDVIRVFIATPTQIVLHAEWSAYYN